jgi:hypothetical protein
MTKEEHSKVMRAIMSYCGGITECIHHFIDEPDTLLCNLEDISGVDEYLIEDFINQKLIGDAFYGK